MKTIAIEKKQIITARQLLIAATVCLLSIYGLFLLTQSAAKTSEKRYLIQSLSKVLPTNSFDNDLLATQTKQGKTTIYQACQNEVPHYRIYEVQTEKGYSGLIKLLVAIDIAKQRIIQVRPLFHQETPGLGDQIEVEKSTWTQQLNQPLSTDKKHIAIKQDGGQIDAITGATITSRAVSDILRQVFFEQTNLQGSTQQANLCAKTQKVK